MPERTPAKRSPAAKAAPAEGCGQRDRRHGRAPAGHGGPETPVALYGATSTIPVNRPEVAALVDAMGLPQASSLSPFTELTAPGARGPARPTPQVMDPISGLSPMTARFAFGPLAQPDRIVDVQAALYNGASKPCRLYSSRRFDGVFAGVRPSMEFDYELLAPFTPDDLEIWIRLQVQFSGGFELPFAEKDFSAQQFAFLLALADAFKANFARSLTERRAEPTSVLVTMGDILEAQDLALTQPDRRWILHAVSELLSLLVHPGGRTDIGLPIVTEAVAKSEIRRYVAEGYAEVSRRGPDPALQLGPSLSMVAGSLFSWVSMLLLHDMQVVDYDDGPVAQEELMLYVVSEQTVWTLVSSGLTRAVSDLSAVTFGLRSLGVIEATGVGRAFLEPIPGIDLDERAYEFDDRSAAPAGKPRSTPAPRPSRATATRWVATHVVPEGGLPTWADADPNSAQTARLDGGLEVSVDATQGAWSHVVCSNGWSAWLDGRALEEV